MILLEIEMGCKGDYAAKVNLFMPHMIDKNHNEDFKQRINQ
jgi:hypothetical protein